MSTDYTCCRLYPSPEPLLSPCLDKADLLSLSFLPVQPCLFTLLWTEILISPNVQNPKGSVNNFRATLVFIAVGTIIFLEYFVSELQIIDAFTPERNVYSISLLFGANFAQHKSQLGMPWRPREEGKERKFLKIAPPLTWCACSLIARVKFKVV